LVGGSSPPGPTGQFEAKPEVFWSVGGKSRNGFNFFDLIDTTPVHSERVHFSYIGHPNADKKEVSLRQLLIQLIELQKIDTQLQQLDALKGDLPNQVGRLNQEILEAEKSFEILDKKFLDYKKESGITELEIKALEGKQKKYQNQLFEVKTNREYDAVTHEIESVKIEISKKESRLLELMELVENTQKGTQELREQITKLHKDYEHKNADLGKKHLITERDELALKDRRAKVQRGIEPKWLSSYERIRNAKNGLALVPVVRNACGGCRKTLPPQRVLEIRERDRLYICDVCGRMLVWDEKISEESG
jgi:uncharacterized protein